jgi:GxxExxY protein
MHSSSLIEPELSRYVVDAYFAVRRELGLGYLESVYREAMLVVLHDDGLHCVRECPLPVTFRGREVGFFRGDILVEDKVLLELKCTARLERAHEAQLLNGLRASGARVGYLMNFGPRGRFERYVL